MYIPTQIEPYYWKLHMWNIGLRHYATSTLFQKLIVCSHLCMKKIFNLDCLTLTSVVLKHGSLYSLEQRFDYKLIHLVCRCLNSLASPLLQEVFVLRSTSHRTHTITRGQVNLSLCLPYVSSNYGKRSFFSGGCQMEPPSI